MLPCPVPPPVPQDEATTLRTLNERLTQLRLKKGDYEKRIRELEEEKQLLREEEEEVQKKVVEETNKKVEKEVKQKADGESP